MADSGQTKTINQILSAIDPAIVSFCLGRAPERPLPQNFEWSHDHLGMVFFLQRLVMFAAMAVSAIATRRLAQAAVNERAKTTYLEKQLFYNIDQVLRGAEFNVHYSMNLLNQELDLTEDLIESKHVSNGNLHKALSDLLRLVAIGQSSFANFSRYQNKNTPQIAHTLLVALPVLHRVKIFGQGLVLDGKAFSAFPFVDVDETSRISLLSSFSGGETPRIRIIRHGASSADEEWRTIPLARQADIAELAGLYGHGKLRPSLKPPTLYRVTEVHQRNLSQLASALIAACHSPDDRVEQWLKPALINSVKAQRIRQIVMDPDTSLLKSCIIKLCLEEDPLSVVERYIRKLYAGKREIELDYLLRAVFEHDLEIRAERERSERDEAIRLGLLDPVSGLDEESDKMLLEARNFHKARMLASRIVRRFGFRVEENARIRGLNDYFGPAYVLQRYLRSCGDNDQHVNVRSSVLAFSELYNLVEEIFRILIGFYVAMKWFDRSSPDGVYLDQRRRLRCIDEMRHVVPLGLNQLLKYWDVLVSDDRLDGKLKRDFGRSLRSISDLNSERVTHLVQGVIDVRHSHAHNSGYGEDRNLTYREIVERYYDAVRGYIDLLAVLRGENSQRFRVFPDVVSLHDVRTNKLGIQSHHYVLVREDPEAPRISEEAITLCTSQPIWIKGEELGSTEAEMPSVFYALAAADEELPGVWVEPALVPVSLIIKHTSPKVRHDEKEHVRSRDTD